LLFFSIEPFFDDSLNLIEVDDVDQQTKLPKTVESAEFISWTITEISIKYYKDDSNQDKKERILQLISLKDEEQTAVCHLRDDWYLMETQAQDIAYVSSM